MPRDKGELKMEWIADKATRNTTFRKRRATLLEKKARELAILCRLDVAMVVYGPGGGEPAFYPPDLAEARRIMQRYVDLPESSKEADRLDRTGFLKLSNKKTGKKLENSKATNRALEVNLVINAIDQGRRSNLDDVPPELAASVRSVVSTFRDVIRGRMNLLGSAPPEVPPPALEEEEEEAAAGVTTVSQQEELLAALEAELMAPLQEPEPPIAVAPMAADALAAVEEPVAAAAAGEGAYDPLDMDRADFPRNGSYLLEMADAIMDDGSGRSVQATQRDVDCLLWQHDLECFIKPKPK